MTPPKTEFKDPILSAFFKKQPVNEPSVDFVSRVMDEIDLLPVYQTKERTIKRIIKTIWPWVLSGGLLVVFYMTSEGVLLNSLKDSGIFYKSFHSLLVFLKSLTYSVSQSTYVPIFIGIGISIILLLGIEHLLRSRKLFQTPLII